MFGDALRALNVALLGGFVAASEHHNNQARPPREVQR
jgi:hypothetical protein